MKTCLNCGSEFPNTLVIHGKLRNISRRKYCLECSPFGERNTRQIHIQQATDPNLKHCSRCNLDLPLSEFYERKDRRGLTSYCKACLNAQATERARRFKQEAIDYKGGGCEICGYHRCPDALCFHHKDPSIKDREIRMSGTYNLDKRKAELDKCHLLCENCHRETHAGLHPDFIVLMAPRVGFEPT